MIKLNNFNITNIYYNGFSILRAYCNNKLVFELNAKDSSQLNSAYASGRWYDDLPWTDFTAWKD